MFYASLNDSNICTGVQVAPSPIIQDNYINITAEVDGGTELSNFQWRKYENGAWSTDKFEPVDTSNGVSTNDRLNALESALLEMMLS